MTRSPALFAALCAAIVTLLNGCATATPGATASAKPSPRSAAAVTRLADRYYAHTLKTHPETAYFSGVNIERHDGLTDNSLTAQSQQHEFEDGLLKRLRAIDPASLQGKPEWITHAYLTQILTSSVARRVCRNRLWNVNQMGGWHLNYSQLAGLQPVDTPAQRAQSLVRWARFPDFIDTELTNLKFGPAQGFTAPRTVVQRVIDQLDGVLALAPDQSPYYSPATRADDVDFASDTYALVQDKIHPALQRYRDYLAEAYIHVARDNLSITGNQDGPECYEASLLHYTTLPRSGKEVFELGKATVAANRRAVIELGKAAYGLDDFDAILAKAKSDPNDRFETGEQVLAFAQDMVRIAGEKMPQWVGNMPAQPVKVVPFPEHEEGTGRSAHYRSGDDDGRAGEYRIPLHKPQDQSRGNAETVAFHEAWPGHHLQVAVSQMVDGLHPITRIAWFSGPGEGWARYSEALAEEMGLYTTTTGPIMRRAWPARGMVVDPGIHLYGWTREEAKTYMLASGRFPASQGDAMVDRIAILPGQLTAYDSGGLEILALRREAQQVMGDEFDLREFHDRILENGTIPLPQLRDHVQTWIKSFEK